MIEFKFEKSSTEISIKFQYQFYKLIDTLTKSIIGVLQKINSYAVNKKIYFDTKILLGDFEK